MRWILLLLLLLNAFYYVWHQQQGPLRAKEVAPAGAYQSARKDIRLLSEADAPRVRAESSAPADAVAPEAAVCLYLGSFEEESRARVVEQRLLSLDIQAEVRSVDAAAGVEYWVYLPPLASRQASLRQLRELQARRIDSYIITQGELANGISLGIFLAMTRPIALCSVCVMWDTSRRFANSHVRIAVLGARGSGKSALG